MFYETIVILLVLAFGLAKFCQNNILNINVNGKKITYLVRKNGICWKCKYYFVGRGYERYFANLSQKVICDTCAKNAYEAEQVFQECKQNCKPSPPKPMPVYRR